MSTSPSRSLPTGAAVGVGIVLGLALAGAALWSFGGSGVDGMGGATAADDMGAAGAPGGAPPAPPVDVVAAVETVAAEPVQLLGSARPVRQAAVASEVDGLVAELQVDEGDVVQAGQVLVRLRTVTVEQRLVAARAGKAEAEARRARAESDFQRLARLRDSNAVSEREYDQGLADRDAAAQAVARLDAELTQLEDQFERATVKAPFAGSVSAVQVEVGEWVDRGDQIVSLLDLSEVEVALQVAERFVSAVSEGFQVDVSFDALPGRSYPGRVTAVVRNAVPEARTFPVLLRIPNRDNAIMGGMAARVLAQLGNPQPAILVSKDAVVRRGDQVLLFRVDGAGVPAASGAGLEQGSTGMVSQVSVDIGPARGEWQVVYGAVNAGDLLIVRGNERVFPGQPVSIANIRTPAVPTADPERPIALDPRRGE